MLTAGNKNFFADNGKGAIPVSDRFCRESAYIRPGSWFRQQHGAGPFAGKHIFQKYSFLFRGTEFFHQMACSLGQPRIHHKREIGAVKIFSSCRGNRSRHPLASPFRIFGGGQPFTFVEDFKQPLKRFRSGDLSVFKFTALLVPFLIGRQEFLNGKIFCFPDDKVYGFFIEISKIFMEPGQGLGFKLFMKNKFDVSSIGNKLGHF